ncbi:MAG TPA: hypothetical protein VMF59_00130 [Bacteroidota bacterium]|nr:hypothetical protein [Bacteroidota bacterium]
MKIKQIRGGMLLAESSRQRLESIVFPSIEKARVEVAQLFPNHVVFSEPGRISVVVRDRSFQVATFQEVHDNHR